MDDLLADFLAETSEGLADLDVALLKLEKSPDDTDTISLIFRLVHTVKGTCGFLSLPRLERVAHAAENLLGDLRDGTLRAQPPLISLVLRAADRMRAIVDGLAQTEAEPAGDDADLIVQLEAARAGSFAAPQAAAAPPQSPAAALPPSASPPATPPPAASPPAASPPAASPPAASPPEALSHEPGHHPNHASNHPPGAAPDPAEPAAAQHQQQQQQTIRVGLDGLDNLMTLAGELVLARNQLLQLARAQPDVGFGTALQRLSQITSDLQEGVMKMRMQPIGGAWAKLPRLVRDLAEELGKRIELVMHGAETELDRQVLELIRDPLTHMVRNSADHGLETPAERRAAGKPDAGRITLSAQHEGGTINIQIGDDGRGLDTTRVRAKALEKGFATAAEIAAMSDGEIHQFVFRPGFSTAEAVTAVSGRGVGMDVVKTNIERIGGTIELISQPGRGTTFVIKIPLTLAIVAALIVEAGGERFALPQIGVLELVRIGANSGARVERINDTSVLRLRDRLLPLVDLSALLRLDPAVAEDRYVVVAQVGASLVGIVVDRVFDTEEIVVKPVAPILRHLTVFGGNTILGDGSVIMILDPHGVARSVGLGIGTDARQAEPDAAQQAGGERMALLVVRAGALGRLAVPLSQVARLERIERERIELTAGGPVAQYRGRLMKLVALAPRPDAPADWPAASPVLVFTRDEKLVGLVVDEIVDVVHDRLDIQLGTPRPGLLGSAVIDGHTADVLDTGHWLQSAVPTWFAETLQGRRTTLLLVAPPGSGLSALLAAAGHGVVTVAAAEAARRRGGLAGFDAVVADLLTPGFDAAGFARDIRGGDWRALPLIGLTRNKRTAATMRKAGWTDCVPSGDRAALADSLAQCLSQPVEV